LIKPGEEILLGGGNHFRVLVLVPFEENDDSPCVGLVAGRGGLNFAA
jgi:hypothetical protein